VEGVDEVGVGGLGLGDGFFGGAVVPVEGCCAVEEDGVEGTWGGMVVGWGQEVGWEGGERGEQRWEGLRTEDVDMLERG